LSHFSIPDVVVFSGVPTTLTLWGGGYTQLTILWQL